MANTEIDRAYRDGQVDAKLEEHSAHLKAINGSQERFSVTLEDIRRLVERNGEQLAGLLAKVPTLETVAAEVTRTREVEVALRQKRLDDQTFWDRYRMKVAWGLGVVTVMLAIGDFGLRLTQ